MGGLATVFGKDLIKSLHLGRKQKNQNKVDLLCRYSLFRGTLTNISSEKDCIECETPSVA